MESKCKGCTDRYVGCHVKCENYLEYVKSLEEHKQKIRKAKAKDKEYRKYKDKQVLKTMRRYK